MHARQTRGLAGQRGNEVDVHISTGYAALTESREEAGDGESGVGVAHIAGSIRLLPWVEPAIAAAAALPG